MRTIPHSALPNPFNYILVELEEKGYTFTCYKQTKGQIFIHFWNEIEFDNEKVYICDTTLHIEKIIGLKPPRNSIYAIFSTLICQEIGRDISASFKTTVDLLNYRNYLGKFVRDCYEGPQEVLYVLQEGESYVKTEMQYQSQHLLYLTNHCLNHVTSEVVEGHLEYHAKMKAKVFPKLKNLK